MWTRKELKDKAKVSFKANYWKSVLMALVLMAVFGGMSMYSSLTSVPAASAPSAVTTTSYSPDDVNVEIEDGRIRVDVIDDAGEKVHLEMDGDDLQDLRDYGITLGDDDVTIQQASAIVGPGLVVAGISIFLVVLLTVAIAIALYVFIFSPLEVGSQRFFVRNLNQRAEVKEVAFGYDNNYKEVVKTLFLRDLFICLWSLLFIIPGIYKAYQYRMIPYLLADDPAMTKDLAFAESKRMMDGQKWNAFVLDLSFLGWNILSALTLGILGVFYVCPYQAQTNAALYEKLRYGLPAPEESFQVTHVAPTGDATAPMATAPIIVSESQPPVPPFAQVVAQPASDAATTAPVLEAGIDPTLPMLGSGENNGAPDSPEA